MMAEPPSLGAVHVRATAPLSPTPTTSDGRPGFDAALADPAPTRFTVASRSATTVASSAKRRHGCAEYWGTGNWYMVGS